MKSKILKSLLIVTLAGVLAVLGGFSYLFTRYLRTAPLFEVREVSVAGLRRLNENEVVAAATFRSGANIFSVDMDKMRDRVERLRWVRHVLVQRVLPDQIVIKVFEREPVGAAVIGGEIYLFDSQAVLLESDSLSGSFAVLYGLRASDREGNLKKVGLYRKVLVELEEATDLSEIHVNDGGEVSVVSGDAPQIVDLGATDLRSRWLSYLKVKPQIEQQLPEAVRIDLRFQGQVVVKMTDEAEERVVWRAGKNSL